MTKEVESDKNDKTHFLDIKAMQSDACHLLSPCHLLSYFVTVHVKRHLCEALSMSRLSVLCQLFLANVNFVNLARLPCAARWDCWVADRSIELPMALTQTVFLFYNVPVAM